MSTSTAWWILIAGGLCEIAWAIGLKYTDSFSRPIPSILTIIAMIVSVLLLAQSMKVLPVGTAYAVWTGIGVLGTTVLGIILFGEPSTAARLISISLIIAGIISLKLITKY